MVVDIIETQSEDAIPTSVVLANEPAWHGQGTVLDTKGKKGLTVEQALPASGLDWTVEKVPMFAMMPGKTMPSKPGGTISVNAITHVERRFGVQRMDTGEILGSVGETWEPVQNLEGFAILNDVIAQASSLDDGYKLWIESAGALDNGRKVWVLARIDRDLQIAGEEYRSYLLFMNGHDGRTSVTAAAVDMRVVCANTLNYAIYEENGKDKEGIIPRIVRVRHTVKAGERIKEAHAILGMRNRRAEELAKQAEWLVEKSMSDGQFDKFLASLMPIKEDAEDTPAATMIEGRRFEVQKLYAQAPNLESIRGTRWGALQAVVEYADHHRDFRDDETQLKAQWDITPATIKDRAYSLLHA